jgi:hypothetical protein
VDSQIKPTMMAISEAKAAPETPIATTGPQPKMKIGASTMLRITEADCATMPGLKLPVPRNAEAIATSANCSAIAGTIHTRYSTVRARVVSSALISRAYGALAASPIIRNSPPATTDSTWAWLKTVIARA